MAVSKKIRQPVSTVEAAYLAGFFDGEGSVCVFRRSGGYHTVQLQATQVDVRPLVLFRRFYGGTLGEYANGPGRMIWKWGITGPAVTWALEDMLPYLIVKRDKAERGLAVRRILKFGGPPKRYTEEEKQSLDSAILEFKRG